jgi:hypothetical protein
VIVFNRQATDPATLPEDVRIKLQLARDALVAGDSAEANHWLYAIACPSFACFDPYAAIEGRRCQCGPHDNLIRQVEVMQRLGASPTQETPAVPAPSGPCSSCKGAGWRDGGFPGYSGICPDCGGSGLNRRV